MEAMVVRVETRGQSPFEKFGPRHYRDIQPDGRDDGTALRAAFFNRPGLSGLKDGHSKKCTSPRCLYLDGPSKYTHEPPAASMPTPAMKPLSFASNPSSPATPRTSCTPLPFAEPFSSLAPFSFTQIPSATKERLSFPGNCPTTPRPNLKRRRPVSDVDGPHTASLGCKKRRLRRRLITSKLSQPFSLPATHVINREAAATGDKRFLKLAAISAARRLSNAGSIPSQLHHPSPSSLLRRAAMINRFRLRVRNEAAERGNIKVADVAANAALLQQSHGVGLVVGARFPVTSQTPPAALAAQALRVPPVNHPHLLPIAAIEARPPPPGPPQAAPVSPSATGLRPPPSPRLKVTRSPELRTTRPLVDVDDYEIDDGESAFPSSEHDSRYDSSDDPDDVYADFELIFCGGAADAESSDEEGEHYEDVMDDLDGIPWTAR